MLHQTLTRRFLCAAIALSLLCAAGVYTSDDALADVVRTRDGQWWPKKIRESIGDTDSPTDAVLKESGSNNLELAYDKGIENFDAALGVLLEGLAALPSWDRTAVIVTSDHGAAVIIDDSRNKGTAAKPQAH